MWLPPDPASQHVQGMVSGPSTGGASIQPGELNQPNPALELPALLDVPAALEAVELEEKRRRTQDCTGAPAPCVHLRQPCGVAVGPGGRVYVSDKGHDRIACFRPDGDFAFAFGRRGRGLGELRDPRGLAVHTGRVFVADMCNHRIAVFSLRGRPLLHYGRYGDGPAELRHPSGVGVAADLLLVSEWNGGRVQVLALDGTFLQSIRQPFGGACLGAIAVDDAGRATVTDSADRLHCFMLERRGRARLVAPPPDESLEPGGPLLLAAARDTVAEEHARVAQLRRTRAGRIQLALEARDYRGVLESLTSDDMAALVPEANVHEMEHPEHFALPPVRSADALAAELEAHLAGRAGPMGPPH